MERESFRASTELHIKKMCIAIVLHIPIYQMPCTLKSYPCSLGRRAYAKAKNNPKLCVWYIVNKATSPYGTS